MDDAATCSLSVQTLSVYLKIVNWAAAEDSKLKQ